MKAHRETEIMSNPSSFWTPRKSFLTIIAVAVFVCLYTVILSDYNVHTTVFPVSPRLEKLHYSTQAGGAANNTFRYSNVCIN